ncbi:Carbonic anhydrase 1 [Maioricimonas rarisocia]|uniref:carbonic anhydrase n=1 Tax=Maioricimonas rarisocia TaxID=2528026 RepID=A0A517Z4X6_9PLAN|nr:carbonic anhydrase [Maioricimonas rarisocia]QDU37538.1 Carbonic anhydrase 1 [Maioricimonas rarisocia]
MIDRLPTDTRFGQESDYASSRELLSAAGYGDEPVIAMVACSDMPCAVDDVLGTRPGELVIVQNAGNRVPLESAVDDISTLSSLWFALQPTTVQYLVICGHTRCRCRDHQGSPAGPASSQHHCVPHSGIVATHEQAGDVTRAGRHVLQQLDAVRTHMFIRERLQRRSLRLHACVVDDRTGTLYSYEPTAGQFAPV